MGVAVMTRQDALGWIKWAVCHRNGPLMCSMTVDQYKEGAEEATARALTLDKTRRGPFKERRKLIAEHARRARNNVGMVMALDTLGYDTASDAAAELHDELGLVEALS